MRVVYRDTHRKRFLACFGISLLLAAGGMLNKPVAPLAFGLAAAVTLAAFLLFLRRTLILLDEKARKVVVLLQRPFGTRRRELPLEELSVLLEHPAAGGLQSLWLRANDGGRLFLRAGDGPQVAPVGRDLARELGLSLDVLSRKGAGAPDP